MSRSRLTIDGSALALGAVLFATGDLLRRLVEPPDATAPGVVAAVASHQGLWTAATVLSMLGCMAITVGAMGILWRSRGRGRALRRAGGALLLLGGMAGVAHASGYFAAYGQWARSNVTADTITALDAGGEVVPVLIVSIGLFMLGMVLGPIVAAVGFYRGRLVPIWVPLVALIFVVAGATPGVIAGVVGLLAATVAFGWMGWRTAAPTGPADLADQTAQVVLERA